MHATSRKDRQWAFASNIGGARVSIAALLLALWATPLQASLIWHWEDSFSRDEREKLHYWLEQTYAAVERYAGQFPFDVHLHMHRRDNSSEPVPWANTRRGGSQALFFYVDASYPRNAFLDDWTAAHEFSHLLLPYLGRQNMWFAEGFASYLQHSIMVEMGMLDEPEAQRRRDRKMTAAQDALSSLTEALPDSAPTLRARGAYPTIYWGGAVFFERVDRALGEEGSSLQQVLRQFLACCRMQRRSLDELSSALDRISTTTVFSAELERMRRTPGAPQRPG